MPDTSPTTLKSPHPHPWRLVGLLAAICFLGHFNRVSMAVAADLQIMPEYGISPTQMGLVYSAFLFAYTLTMIPGGWLIDEHGPRFALAAMCMLSALFVALTGVVGLMTATMGVALAALFLVRGMMGAVALRCTRRRPTPLRSAFRCAAARRPTAS